MLPLCAFLFSFFENIDVYLLFSGLESIIVLERMCRIISIGLLLLYVYV